jgi:hypothetical protein
MFSEPEETWRKVTCAGVTGNPEFRKQIKLILGESETPIPFMKEKRGNPTCCPPVISYPTKRLPAITSAVAAAAATATAISPLHWLSLVNRKSPAIELGAVQRLDGVLSLAAGTHLHKAEAS